MFVARVTSRKTGRLIMTTEPRATREEAAKLAWSFHKSGGVQVSTCRARPETGKATHLDIQWHRKP